MEQNEHGHYKDRFGRLCALPPPGMVIMRHTKIDASAPAGTLRDLKTNRDESSKFSVGIWFNRHINLYEAQLKVDGKKIHVGSYNTIGEAEKARKDLIEVWEKREE